MTHKISSVTFYQTVTIREDCVIGRKAFNTIDENMLTGVKLSRLGESIIIEHDKFKESYCVGMANVRHYRFTDVLEAAAEVQPSDNSDLVNLPQYENTPLEKAIEEKEEDVDILKERERLLERKNKAKAKKKTKKKVTKKKASKKCTTAKKKNS